MRVLVTGGAGFIGSHVVDQLVDGGAEVIIIDSIDAAAHECVPDYLNSQADVRLVSVLDEAAVTVAVENVDAVCHQAARVGLGVDLDDITGYVHDNDLGTAVLLRALWRRRFNGRLVVASSMAVYGEGGYRCDSHGIVRPPPRAVPDLERGQFEPACPHCGNPVGWLPIDEDAAADPRNVYAATKLHTEHLASSFGREAGVDVCALRYHNVYGPRMPRHTPYAGVASIFHSALARGEAPCVLEDGGQLRDFVHVRDVARANALALDSRFAGPLNIASGVPHSILDLATGLSRSYGVDAPVPVVTGGFRLGDVRHVVASPARAAERIGFSAEVSFHDGMRDFASAPLRQAAS